MANERSEKRPVSEEVRRRMSQAALRRWANPTYRKRQLARIHAAARPAMRRPEVRARIRQAALKRWRDPVYRAKNFAAIGAGMIRRAGQIEAENAKEGK